MATRKSTVTVASLADGETKLYTFDGDTMLLTEVVSEAGFDLDEVNSVERNELPIADGDLETATVRNGDVVYLIPLIEGGKK